MFDENFDQQKLMYHPHEVAHWLKNGFTAGPIYTEFELTNACNQHCIFCGVDHLVNHHPQVISHDQATHAIDQLTAIGNKSIMFSGHGEPLLHPQAEKIISYAAKKMSASVTTNGFFLTSEHLSLIDDLEWIRFSVNGTNSDNYALIHRTSPEEYTRVLENIGAAVKRKREKALSVTIGVQLVLLNENILWVTELAERVKQIGVDYFSVKPYSHHPLSDNNLDIDYSRYPQVQKEITNLEDNRFRVIMRDGSFTDYRQKKSYRQCFGTHFINYISADCNVWECNVYVGNDRFLIGNTMQEDLQSIWHGPKRRECLRMIEENLKLDDCRTLCRMHQCNKYLARLHTPHEHDNFI